MSSPSAAPPHLAGVSISNKKALLALFIILVVIAIFGKAPPTSPVAVPAKKGQLASPLPAVRGYTFYGSPILYPNLADTAKRQTLSSPTIPPGGQAYVVKQLNSRWYIVSFSPEGTAPHYYLHHSSFSESAPLNPASHGPARD
jgi:hypothetical protein